MKLDDVKKVNEMAKPKQICSKCGHPMANFHTYRGKKPDGSPDWRCKSTVAPAPGYGNTPALAPGQTAPAATPTAKKAPASASPAASAGSTPAAAPAATNEASIEAQITKWLTTHGISGFKIGANNVIDVEDDATFRNLNRTELPSKVQFGSVGGDFIVSSCGLAKLRGCPKEVGTSEFGGNFLCNHNELTDLEGGPEVVNGYYSASGNDKLESIKGVAKRINGSLLLSNLPKLTSLEGIQDMIEHIGNEFDASGTPLASHVVGLMLIDGLESVKLQNKDIEKILNKHLKAGRNPYDCQEELIDAGFDAFAQL